MDKFRQDARSMIFDLFIEVTERTSYYTTEEQDILRRFQDAVLSYLYNAYSSSHPNFESAINYFLNEGANYQPQKIAEVKARMCVQFTVRRAVHEIKGMRLTQRFIDDLVVMRKSRNSGIPADLDWNGKLARLFPSYDGKTLELQIITQLIYIMSAVMKEKKIQYALEPNWRDKALKCLEEAAETSTHYEPSVIFEVVCRAVNDKDLWCGALFAELQSSIISGSIENLTRKLEERTQKIIYSAAF